MGTGWMCWRQREVSRSQAEESNRLRRRETPILLSRQHSHAYVIAVMTGLAIATKTSCEWPSWPRSCQRELLQAPGVLATIASLLRPSQLSVGCAIDASG
jgi:hypothetical protein